MAGADIKMCGNLELSFLFMLKALDLVFHNAGES